MSWKLSHVEQIVEVNILCVARLEGRVNLDQVRSALAHVQRKHPALRALIREEPDGLYYQAECAPEIPLRVVPRVSEDGYRRECQTELATPFAHGQPQLRAVWLHSALESDLLLTTSHRMCDGMSVFLIVREVLRALYTRDEASSYEPVTVQDIIGDYRPPRPWKRKLAVTMMNGLMRLVPRSRRAPINDEHDLEWSAGIELSTALKQRCKAEGVSVHALLVVALERALFAVLGKKLPKAIVNPIDMRRGRFPALKSDMVFFGGGNFKIKTEASLRAGFWTRARAVNEEIRREVDREILEIPSRFHFLEALRPLSGRQIQFIVRLGDALHLSGNWNRFGLSNLGNVMTSFSGAPFRLKDLRLYLHSFNVRMLGLVPYPVEGDMRFYCVSDERCMSRRQVDTFRREFMDVLRNQALGADSGTAAAREEGHDAKTETVHH